MYFRVVLFLAPYFGLFIKFAFYRSKKKNSIENCKHKKIDEEFHVRT